LTTFSNRSSDYELAAEENRFVQFFMKTRETMMAELREDIRNCIKDELDEEIGCLFKEMGHLRASVATSLNRQRSLASGLAKVMAAIDELDGHDKFGFHAMRNEEFLSTADSEIDREWKAFFMISDDPATAPIEPLHESMPTSEAGERVERGPESGKRVEYTLPSDDIGSEGKLGIVRTSQRQQMRPSNRAALSPIGEKTAAVQSGRQHYVAADQLAQTFREG
jgi:hypothetical protein